VYVETTIVSYLTARRSGNLVVAAHQEITRGWWKGRRLEFELYCSQAVIREASAGDKHAAEKPLAALENMPLLEINESAKRLATALVKVAALPEKATEDALHIALATAHGMDYLLTWNCKHIANAEIRNVVAAVSYEHGFGSPVICTPEELMGK
jgi:hypothetical protein